jgi:hypothetical protein
LRLRVAWATGVCLLASAGAVNAQSAAPTGTPTMMSAVELPVGTPQSWAEDAIQNEMKVIQASDKVPLRYRQRKVGEKGDTTREIIVSRDGNVARMVERDGQALSAKEDADERDRLKDQLDSPDDFLRHRRKDLDTRDSVVKVVALMPHAMLYSYALGQPQLKGSEGESVEGAGGAEKLVVLDFHPNPEFHAPTMIAECLTGLEGRVWIDPKTRYLRRIEARVVRPVNMGFGILAKIYPGGTLALDQTNLGGEHWVYSHLDEHLMARVLMVKNYPQNTVITSWDFRPMTSLLSFQDGIRMLLAMPVATK